MAYNLHAWLHTANMVPCRQQGWPSRMNVMAENQLGYVPAVGKCGMRFHVDPLYGVWATPTAVVSLGHTRTFIFREISDYNIRYYITSMQTRNMIRKRVLVCMGAIMSPCVTPCTVVMCTGCNG